MMNHTVVELVPHMLDQVKMKVQKHQSWCQFRFLLNDACRTSRCLIVNRWSNDESDSVIVLIEGAITLVIDDHVVQDNTSMHDQPKSLLRVRLVEDG
jgi:hypothetical protein